MTSKRTVVVIAMRDDFPSTVKQTVAQRAGHRCSSPTCGATTSGPQIDPTKAINVGVAAHITAASPGGPRYNPALSSRERTSPENGIWLCQTCAKLIDNDVIRFTEALLKHWKMIAENRASQELGRQSPFDNSAAPSLEVAPSGMARLVTPLPEALSPPEIRRLLGLFPAEFRDPEQVELLGSGRGAMGQRFGIVGAGTNHGWDWSVGLFSGGEFGWELVANVRLRGQKAWIPEAVYIPGTPGALVLTHVHGYGTGVFRRSTSWYRIVKGEPAPFLSYPRRFYVVGWGMPFGRELTSITETMPTELTDGAQLQLRFDVSYTMLGEASQGSEIEFLTTSERLALEWNAAAGIFVPHTAADDFGRIEEIWREGTEGFATRNADRLGALLQRGTPMQRSFIKRHFNL